MQLPNEKSDKKLCIDANIYNDLLKPSHEKDDQEICGMLTGTIQDNNVWHATTYHDIPNVDTEFNKHHYELDPNTFFRLLSNTTFLDENANTDFIGIFHTHPFNRPFPSTKDVKQAGYRGFYPIYSPKYEEMGVYYYDGSKPKQWKLADLIIQPLND